MITTTKKQLANISCKNNKPSQDTKYIANFHKCFEILHIQLYISHNPEQYCVHSCLIQEEKGGN